MSALLRRSLPVLGVAGLARRGAAAFPDRPVRALVGFPPGTPPDVAIRLVSAPMGERLGTSVIVENRPGASGIIAAEAMLRAAPDGHTLLVMANGLPLQLAMRRQAPFDAAEVLPLAGLAQAPMLLVASPGLDAADVQTFLGIARRLGDRLSIGTSGVSSAPARAMAQLADAAGITPTAVAYRGDIDIATAVLGGQIQAGFVFLGVAVEHVRDGRLRALAVTSAERVAQLPGVPTTAELGMPGVDVIGAWAVAAARATPAATQGRIIEAVRAARGTAAYRQSLIGAGAVPLDMDGDRLRDVLARDHARQVALLRRLGVEPE